MGTVVVGLDGSDVSHVAFRAALRAAELTGDELRVVHVFAYPATTIYQATHIEMSDLQATAEAWLEKELAALEEDLGEFRVPVEGVVEMGHAGSVLVEQASDAELLVVGSRGLGGFRGPLLGSVSTFCTHHLSCPLLIVPMPEAVDGRNS